MTLATKVIMPALGMAQETGKLVSWFKKEGAPVTKGEPIMEIETDKVTVEIEALASGALAGVSANVGEEIPVGQTIAWILAPGESIPKDVSVDQAVEAVDLVTQKATPAASPVARKIAEEHDVDLSLIQPSGGRIQKVDVLGYLENQKSRGDGARLAPASPKARRLAHERGLDLASLAGTGSGGAVLAANVLAIETRPAVEPQELATSTIWQRMAERVTQSWTSAPHFYLLREANASRLVEWKVQAQRRTGRELTYTDLLVKLVATALRQHPRVNAAWEENTIVLKSEINIGLAISVKDGLVAPVIHRADELGLSQIAERRQDLISRAQAGKLSPDDLRDGTFTISNLGMYGVDIFTAVLNPPQAALLAVGRITERVVPMNGQPAVQPTIMLSLSCDHRVIDGANGAQFLQTLVNLLEEPLRLVD